MIGKFGPRLIVASTIGSTYQTLRFLQLSSKLNKFRPVTPSMACAQVFFLDFCLVFFTARRYASAVLAVIVCLSVCPSVRPSVTSRSCTKMAKPRIRLTTQYDSPKTLVFRCQKSWRNSHDITPTRAPNRGGVGS